MRYSIEGEPLPVVILETETNETILTQRGAMSWMSSNMQMETNTAGGGLGKLFGRALTGESIFLNRYTSVGGPGLIAFAACFPGSIRAFNIAPGQEIVAQKKAFLASSAVKVSSCSVCPATASRSWNLTVIPKNMFCSPVSR